MFDAKSEKPADAFFAYENPDENAALSFATGTQILEREKMKDSTGGHDPFISFLKKVFLFLPGTFLLFYMSFGAAVIFLEIVVFRRKIQTLPDAFPLHVALFGLIILLGTLMTWFGSGDIKNRKHFAIPASLMITGAALGALAKVIASFSNVADRMLDDLNYLIYLLPIAWIIPILAKGIVDRKTEAAEKHLR